MFIKIVKQRHEPGRLQNDRPNRCLLHKFSTIQTLMIHPALLMIQKQDKNFYSPDDSKTELNQYIISDYPGIHPLSSADIHHRRFRLPVWKLQFL